MTSPYTEADLHDITVHAYGHSIATGAINPADARERVRRVLTWLTDHYPEQLAKVTRERDSLARRCAARFEETERLRDERDQAHAAGYAEAIARLRDDDRYRNWWTARNYPPEDRYWQSTPRNHLADYLETVGPTVNPGEPA